MIGARIEPLEKQFMCPPDFIFAGGSFDLL